MVEYIEKLLHLKAEEFAFEQIAVLPLYLKNAYTYSILKLVGVECLAVKPKEKTNLASVRKHYRQLKKITGLECVFVFEELSRYAKQRMTAEGMPFIIEGKQIYMPFMGVAIGHANRQFAEVDEISFLTQKLLLTAVYQHWHKVLLCEAAGLINVSDMSISRCFDEIEAVGLPLIVKEGRGRYFVWQSSKRQLWELIFPLMRNPVYKTYLLEEKLISDSLMLSGMSALCHYSMLADSVYQTFAVAKATAKEMNLTKQASVPAGEVPAMVIQVLQYHIPFGDGKKVDPLTAVLSMTQEKNSDPRVEAAIDEVLEEFLSD